MSCRHPQVKWAQRSDKLHITIDLPDAQDVKLNMDPRGKFYFSATAGADKLSYEVDIDLYDKVDVNESKASVGSRNICYLVKKAESKWWSRLLKQEGKPPVFLKVDWDKWVDEDEEQDNKFGNDTDFGDFDFSKLNMAGGGGLDAMDKDDEEDESDTEAQSSEQATSSGNKPGIKAVATADEGSSGSDAKA